MNKPQALQLLHSAGAHDRLIAARYFARAADSEDIDSIEKALRKENVSWVRNALSAALSLARGQQSREASTNDEMEPSDQTPTDQQIQEIHANALRETTSLILHEVEPLLGTARLYAKREIPGFDASKTKTQLDLLEKLLNSISELRKASTPGRPTEIELSSMIREIKDCQGLESIRIEIQLAGPSPFNVFADQGRLWLAIANGLRNAIESTGLVDEQDRRPIIINWNRTDQDFWISIIDHGAGLKASLAQIFKIGTSSKANHLGMGLPAARQAVLSMGGDLTVAPREDAGVTFVIRWPRFVRDAI
jgi:signal transduction histidine kinase